jgi:hypothetical protein
MEKLQNQGIKSPWDNKLYSYWGAPGSKESRERTPDQTIGTASSRNVTKQKVLVTLKELTVSSLAA